MSPAVPNDGLPPTLRETAGELRMTTGRDTTQTCNQSSFSEMAWTTCTSSTCPKDLTNPEPFKYSPWVRIRNGETGAGSALERTEKFGEMRADVVKTSVAAGLEHSKQ